MQPYGTLSFDQAYSTFAEQVIAGAKGRADLILIETMSDVYEAKAAILAAQENSDLPVIATMNFSANGRTLTERILSPWSISSKGWGLKPWGSIVLWDRRKYCL